MTLHFKAIELSEQAEYNKRFDICCQPASDYTFTNLWAWAEEYNLSWAWDDQLVWIKQNQPIPCYWAPIGNWQDIDWRARLAPFHGKEPFVRIPETLANLWQKNVAPKAREMSREHWDYIYTYNDLIELKGNRFHKKKNLFRQFQKQQKTHTNYKIIYSWYFNIIYVFIMRKF